MQILQRKHSRGMELIVFNYLIGFLGTDQLDLPIVGKKVTLFSP